MRRSLTAEVGGGRGTDKLKDQALQVGEFRIEDSDLAVVFVERGTNREGEEAKDLFRGGCVAGALLWVERYVGETGAFHATA